MGKTATTPARTKPERVNCPPALQIVNYVLGGRHIRKATKAEIDSHLPSCVGCSVEVAAIRQWLAGLKAKRQ